MTVRKILLYVLMCSFQGCNFDLVSRKEGPGGGPGGLAIDPNDNVGGKALAIANTFPETALQDVFFEFNPDVSGATGVQWTVTGLPPGLSADQNSGRVSGFPEVVGSYNVTLKGNSPSGEVTLDGDIEVVGDPLVKYQWQLFNSGQTAFAARGGTSRQDMNTREAIRNGITGKGVRVAVSDTGVAVNHPGLSKNTVGGGSRNYGVAATNNMYSGDPTPVGADAADDVNAHGTAVAGIVAEAMGKRFGGHGIAPDASIVGFNYLLHQGVAGTDLDQLQSYDQAPIDIFNQSWGFDELFPVPSDPAYIAQLRFGTRNFRNGKGAIYVRAAGNFYVRVADNDGNFLSQNANSEEDNANPYTLVVSAMNASGIKASYSAAGAAVWVSGLGGENGSTDAAIITTDLPGCNEGFSHNATRAFLSGALPVNGFEWGGPDQLALNPNCDYTSIMNGTSSASPSVVGVVALILQANPNLTWRDVFYVLAKTSTKVEPNILDKTNTLDVAGYVNEPKWFNNSAGFHFHNFYGFGRPDAMAAITLAKGFMPTSQNLTNTVVNRDVNLAIPNINATGVTDTMAVNIANNPKIFTVILRVTSTHPMAGELGFELTSPSGTKSVVLNSSNSFVGANLNGTPLTNVALRTNAFLDEPPNGNWRLRVIDTVDMLPSVATPLPHTGNLTNWKLDLYY